MNIIASQEDASQQQRASEVCDHSFIILCKSNLFIILNTIFQLFCCRKENKMEPDQHIRQDNKEKIIDRKVCEYLCFHMENMAS
jgi:hypothetical protein